MKCASAKNKGRSLQKWTRDLLLSLSTNRSFPDLEPDDIKSNPSGCNGEDVLLSPAARRVWPISIECKNQEKLNVWNAYDQAVENAGSYEPVVVFKKNRKEPKVMVDARFFFKVLSIVKLE